VSGWAGTRANERKEWRVGVTYVLACVVEGSCRMEDRVLGEVEDLGHIEGNLGRALHARLKDPKLKSVRMPHA